MDSLEIVFGRKKLLDAKVEPPKLFGGDVFKNPARDIDYEEHVS